MDSITEVLVVSCCYFYWAMTLYVHLEGILSYKNTLLFQALPIIFLLLEPLRSLQIRLCTCFSWQSRSHSPHSHHGHCSRWSGSHSSCQSCSQHGRWGAAVADPVSVAAHGGTVISSICAADMQQAAPRSNGWGKKETACPKRFTGTWWALLTPISSTNS